MRKRLTGTVTSDKMDKSLRVEIPRLYRHPKYGKIVRGRTICYVHDEENAARAGDVVEIIEGRPRSKQKRWDLVRVVERSAAVGTEASEASGATAPGAETAAATEPQS